MLRSRLSSLLRLNLRTPTPIRSHSNLILISTTSAIALSTFVYLNSTNGKPLLAQSNSNQGYETQSQLHGGKIGSIKPNVFIWGRDSHNVASVDGSGEIVKKPKLVKAFDGMVLRDLKLSETYGVAVDDKGDVLQWGLGFTSPSPSSSSDLDPSIPHPTLINRNIVSVSLSPTKIFALSKKGQVYVFPVDSVAQKQRGEGNESAGSWWRMIGLGEGDSGVDCVKLGTDSPLKNGEKIISLSSGSSHLLALTSHSRSFSLPINLLANQYGQLGARRLTLSTGPAILAPDLGLNAPKPLPPMPKNLDPLLMPSSGKSPLATPPTSASPSISGDTAQVRLSENEEENERLQNDIRFCTTLTEIPALKGVEIKQLVAGDSHSVALTGEGRVLGWGANNYGQLGLGASLSLPAIPTPTEIPLGRSFTKMHQVTCKKIAAGGHLTYFVVDKVDLGTGGESVDVLATGNGQYGGIGNGTWAHAAIPVRVKTISGLQEWNDEQNSVRPIEIRDIRAGKTHVALVLDNAVSQPGGIKFGRDVFVWGHNEHYQLGTGKRSNLSIPQHLPPLPYPGLVTPLVVDVKDEGKVESGTISPMPHSRLQLAPEIKVKGKIVEETIVAGDGGTAVYWKILNP